MQPRQSGKNFLRDFCVGRTKRQSQQFSGIAVSQFQVRSQIEQKIDNFELLSVYRVIKRGMAGAVSRGDVTDVSSQSANHFQIAMHRRDHQRRYSGVVAQVRAGAGIQQPLSDRAIFPQDGGEKQRSIVCRTHIRILVFAKVAIDQRSLVRIHRANEFIGRNWFGCLPLKGKPNGRNQKEDCQEADRNPI